MQKDIKYWLEIADYDLNTAAAMLESKRYLYVLFTCQQAMEKILKALITAKLREFPPRIHNLVKLLDMIGIVLNEEDKLFLGKLSYYYLETRYPEELVKVGRQVNQKLAKRYFIKTKEIIRCLRQKIE